MIVANEGRRPAGAHVRKSAGGAVDDPDGRGREHRRRNRFSAKHGLRGAQQHLGSAHPGVRITCFAHGTQGCRGFGRAAVDTSDRYDEALVRNGEDVVPATPRAAPIRRHVQRIKAQHLARRKGRFLDFRLCHEIGSMHLRVRDPSQARDEFFGETSVVL